MPVLTVGGTPRERGRAIGETLREDIRVVYAKHEASISDRPGFDLQHYQAAFDTFGRFEDAVAKWGPDLLEEVRGLAEGANIPFQTAFRAQLGDEDWFFDAYKYRPQASLPSKCTAFGLVGDNGTPGYAGQNMDIQSYVDGHQLLLRIQYPDSDLESLVFSYSGYLGLCGMNNSTLGVNCNTLMQLGLRPDGLPVTFIVRALLEKRSFDDAVAFVTGITHAAGQNYTISTRHRVGSYECSPNKVVEYRPRIDGSRVCHTNHPLVNDDTADFEALKRSDPENRWVRPATNSCARLASIAARTLNRDGTVTLADLKAALRARDDPANPVCFEPDESANGSVIAFTAGSMVFEHSDHPRLHLAAGPPSRSEFMEFSFGD